MLSRDELLRTAGNCLLLPVALRDLPGAGGWQRVLLLGSQDQQAVSEATRQLRAVAPEASIETLSDLAPRPGLRALRRPRRDAVCLLLTGEGRGREKLLSLLSGAHIILAFGSQGEWYRLALPPVSPLRPRWWARAALAGLLVGAYLVAMEAVLFAEFVLWRLRPRPRPAPAPKTAAGRRVTFVVPTYNQRALMDLCLPALLAEAGEEHAVILVDDAGSDGTAEYVRDRYPEVRVIRLRRNRGFAGAVRAGIAASDTPLFALINDDAIVQPGFLRAILPHFDRPDVFAVCSRIDLSDGSQIETGRVVPAFSGVFEPHHVAPTEPGPIFYAGGASSVFDRAKYEALGRLETLYRPIYWEDIDLGWAAWRRGWRSLFEPGASVEHRRRATMGPRLGGAGADRTFLRNGILFIWKNLRDRRLLTQHFVYIAVRLVREVLEGEDLAAGAVLKALPALPRALLRRWQVHGRGDLADRQILALLGVPRDGYRSEVGARHAVPSPEGAGPQAGARHAVPLPGGGASR
jgi:GT2 family glycosyltransferase